MEVSPQRAFGRGYIHNLCYRHPYPDISIGGPAGPRGEGIRVREGRDWYMQGYKYKHTHMQLLLLKAVTNWVVQFRINKILVWPHAYRDYGRADIPVDLLVRVPACLLRPKPIDPSPAQITYHPASVGYQYMGIDFVHIHCCRGMSQSDTATSYTGSSWLHLAGALIHTSAAHSRWTYHPELN